MGYALCIGSCCACGGTFSFNPVSVPSTRDKNGEKQPICQACVDRTNIVRKQRGLPPIVYASDAYSYCNEVEL